MQICSSFPSLTRSSPAGFAKNLPLCKPSGIFFKNLVRLVNQQSIASETKNVLPGLKGKKISSGVRWWFLCPWGSSPAG